MTAALGRGTGATTCSVWQPVFGMSGSVLSPGGSCDGGEAFSPGQGCSEGTEAMPWRLCLHMFSRRASVAQRHVEAEPIDLTPSVRNRTAPGPGMSRSGPSMTLAVAPTFTSPPTAQPPER